MSKIACLDLEGVLVPEIWIGVADKTGISDLKATTRDISDYSELMRMRLNVCDQNGLTLKDINEVISNMSPLDGAEEFLHWLRENFQVVILFSYWSRPKELLQDMRESGRVASRPSTLKSILERHLHTKSSQP